MQFSNAVDAIDQVKRGQAWGAIVLYENFTENTMMRLLDMVDRTVSVASVIDNSTIHMYLDVTGMKTLNRTCVVNPVKICILDIIMNGKLMY